MQGMSTGLALVHDIAMAGRFVKEIISRNWKPKSGSGTAKLLGL